jgi:flagellar biosynthesis protein FlhF
MKIIRHTARDMRQALRAVREQLGEDAVILSSRRTGEGVEVTAAVDFDASTLEAGGFSEAPAAALPPVIDVTAVAVSARGGSQPASTQFAAPPALPAGTGTTRQAALSTPTRSTAGPAPTRAAAAPARANAAAAPAPGATSAGGRPSAATNPTVLALTMRRPPKTNGAEQTAKLQQVVADAPAFEPAPQPAPSYDELAALERVPNYNVGYDADWISEAAREAVAEHVAAPRAPVLTAAPEARANASYEEIAAAADPVEEIREATLTPLASNEIKATFAEFEAAAAATPAATEAMGNELKTLRRMLETQLAHLAWNDLTRRAPVHTEMLRELTEIGITQDLAEHLVRQLPEDTDLTFARRFTIAGISQYLKVTGDHWFDNGGRVAFAGATGVGKTTTLAKIAVRWVLRHGPRDIALVAGDSVRIGAQDQLQSLAQLLGVPVYTPEKFEHLPLLLSRLSERLVLIDTPGSSVRDPQLASRLAVLSNSASKLETALVLAASTQAGAIEEAVKHFAPANPSCCVLTKLDEAASLGGVLSILIRARMPVSYMSEGQRVPEDLRPARALELVSAAVRLAKARGAAADEDLLRRRFGKTAHGIS